MDVEKEERQYNYSTDSNQKQAFRPQDVKCSIELSGETLKMETFISPQGPIEIDLF